ncbi:hypothetical protein SLEP1_g23424 [Rubroshorea leprosula]|nr:hypothetical protein SLEP1_g23424 [Rubroshorea leprosula]
MGNDGNEQWSWNLQWRRKLFEWETEEAKELQQLIEDKRITHGRPDSWEWVHDKDGQYSTKTAYSILTKDQIETNEISTFKRIWNPKFPSKVSAFNWQLLLDRVPTKANLVIRGILGELEDGKCVFCKVEDEDSKHLFLKCKITSWVWQECAKWWGIEIRLERDCWDSFQMFGKWSKDPKVKEGWDCIWSTVIWTVWLARNQMIFQDKKTDPRKLLEIIQVRSFQWITANLDRGTDEEISGCTILLSIEMELGHDGYIEQLFDYSLLLHGLSGLSRCSQCMLNDVIASGIQYWEDFDDLYREI